MPTHDRPAGRRPRHVHAWLGGAGFVVLVLASLLVALPFTPGPRVAGLVLATAGLSLIIWASLRTLGDWVRSRGNEPEPHQCQGCATTLRGVADWRCPECGRVKERPAHNAAHTSGTHERQSSTLG